MTNLSTILSEGLVVPLRGYLSGLILSTAGSSATFSVAAGMAVDDGQKEYMNLSSAISKTTSAWAVGSGNGGLDTGSVAINTWYHVYLIKRVDTGVVDILTSLSATSPTMPTNYTLKRRIGSIKTNGSSQWYQFTQTGDIFIWTNYFAGDGLNNTSGSTTFVDTTLLGVPTGVQVETFINVTNATSMLVLIAGGGNHSSAQGCWSLGGSGSGQFRVLTNTSGQISWKTSATTASALTSDTLGYVDQRGKLS